jgi:hypothetical protein
MTRQRQAGADGTYRPVASAEPGGRHRAASIDIITLSDGGNQG